MAVVIILALVAAGCGLTDPEPSPTTNAEASEVARGAFLAVDSLPRVALDPAAHLVICDPYPNQADSDAGEATVLCIEGSWLALRAITLAGGSGVERLYLTRRPCDVGLCHPDVLHTASVSGWIGQDQAVVDIDSRLDRVAVIAPAAGVAWPTIRSAEPSPDEPISIVDALADLETRQPLPSCGSVDLAVESLTAPETCFLGAVLRGEPVELLETLYSVEGDAVTVLYRFEGTGAVIRFLRGESGVWQRAAGGLIINPESRGFSFEEWP